MIEINIVLFHLGEVDKMFLICVAKAPLFLEVVCAFLTSQIKLLPNHQYLCGNFEYSVNENASAVRSAFLFERLVFTFIIIKLKTKLNTVTFLVKVKGPTLNFKYFSTCFCCKSVSCNYVVTYLTSTLPTWFRASSIVQLWQRCSH